MKLARNIPHWRSFKFAPFLVIAFFVLTNITGVFFSAVLAPSVSAEAATLPPDIPSSGDVDLDWIIFRAGESEGVDPRFIHAVIWQESKYELHAVSGAGARGLMQLMPATARRFGCTNPDDAASNIKAGTKYLAWLLTRFNGDVELALAGYNAGEGSVDKYKGIPPYNETQNYVHKIVARYGKTFHPIVPVEEARLALEMLSKNSQAGSPAVE